MDSRDLIDAIGVRTAEDEAVVYIAVDGSDESHGDAVGGGRGVAGLEAVEAALRRDAVSERLFRLSQQLKGFLKRENCFRFISHFLCSAAKTNRSWLT